MFQGFQGVYAFGRLEKVTEGRSVKSQISVGPDFSGLPRRHHLWKVEEGGWSSKMS